MGFALSTSGNFGSIAAMPGGATFDMNALAGGMGDPAKCQDLESKLAANLGVTTDALEAAIKKTILQEIDAAEQAGTLTADQAQQARDRVNNSTDICAGFGGGMGGPGGQRPAAGQGGDRTAMMFGGAVYDAVANYFQITTDQLKQDATDLGTLQAIAAKYGKDNATDKAKLEAAIEKALTDELTQRGVPQEMIDQIVSQFKTNFDTIYTSPLGGDMPMVPGGQNGPGQRGPRIHPGASPSPSPTSSTQ
jgi:hypothetical protein